MQIKPKSGVLETSSACLISFSGTRAAKARHVRPSQRRVQSSEDREPTGQSDEREGSTLRSDPGPTDLIKWGGYIPDTRRAIVGFSSAAIIAMVGNLGGVTSGLLGIDDGKTAASLRLDALFPVKGFKRCLDFQNGFEFVYPADWLADQTLYRRRAERLEKQRPLDLPPVGQLPRPKRTKYDPSAAFGPPRSTGEDNISVIAAPITPDFTVQKLGTPDQAAESFVRNTIAPPGSNKHVAILSASSFRTTQGDTMYLFEFTVEVPSRWKRHNVAVFAARQGILYNYNAQCAESRWPSLREKYIRSAKSFTIFPTSNPNFSESF